MKIKLFIFLSLLTAFVSCKKDDAPKEEPVSSDNPVAFSKSIKVYHGERIQGTLPSANSGGSSLVIEAPADGIVMAMAGKFAIIKPELLSGEIAGYYLTVTGANEYFKIDFSKPRLLANGKGIKPNRRKTILRPFGVDSTGNGNGDSSIVIALPALVQIPDTICVTFSPYDSQGNIGQPVTTCIMINHIGADASTSWLQGSWQIVADRDDSSLPWEEHSAIGKMEAVPWGYAYYCGYDSLSGATGLMQKECFWQDCNNVLARDSASTGTDSLVLHADGNMSYLYAELSKRVDYDYSFSPCNQIKFVEEPYSYAAYGSWSAESNKLILVYEFIGSGEPEYEAMQAQLIKVSDREFIVTDEYGYQTKLKKK